MDFRSLKLLEDIQTETALILGLAAVDDWSFATSDVVTTHAIERSFEIIAIALGRLERHRPGVIEQISDFQKIQGFRNRIAHGYDEDLKPAAFDDIIRNHLPILAREVAALRASLDE